MALIDPDTTGDTLPATEPQAVPDWSGRILADGYRIKEKLGQGGMGAVYRAVDVSSGRSVAVKFLLRAYDEVRQQRFIREAEHTAALDHPGILRIHASGQEGGRAYIVYELVEGARRLDAVLAERTLEEKVALIRDVANALGYAHAAGVVHRDVKPANLLVDTDGRVRVVDFGLALGLDQERLTQSGAVLGTPSYVAPETLKGGKDRPGPAGDVWSLGVILFQSLTGKHPFAAQTLVELFVRVHLGPTPRIRFHDPSLPAALEDICCKALERDPKKRYPDGAALVEDLTAFLEGRTPGASRGRPFGRLLAVAGAATALVLLGLAATLLWPSALPELPEPAIASPSPTVPPAPITSHAAPLPLRLALREVVTVPGPRREARGIFLTAERFLTWGHDSSDLTLWRMDPDGPRRVSTITLQGVQAIDVDPSGDVFVVATRDRHVRWFRKSGRLTKASLLGKRQVSLTPRVIAVVPGSPMTCVVGGSHNEKGAARVVAPDRRLQSWSIPGKMVTCVAVSSDVIVLGSGRNFGSSAIRQGHLQAESLIGDAMRWQAEIQGTPNALAIDPVGSQVVVASEIGRLTLHSLKDGAVLREFHGRGAALTVGEMGEVGVQLAHAGGVRGVAYLPDGSLLSVSRLSGTFGLKSELRAWRPDRVNDLVCVGDLSRDYRALTVSPDGRYVLLGVDHGLLEVRRLGQTPTGG